MLCGSQQRLQLQQGVAADSRRGHRAKPTTRGWLNHPCWYLYGSTIPLLLETAPTQGLPTFDEHLVYGDSTTEPWMPRITDFSRLSIMGVGLSTCTMAITKALGTS